MNGGEWKQRLIDFERSDRWLDMLRRHLVDCRFPRSQIELLVSCARDGQAITEPGVSRSLLRASNTEVAALTGLSRTAIHKAKEALVAAGLMRYTRGHYLASWLRVRDLRPPPDSVAAMLAGSDEGQAFTSVHQRSPAFTSVHQRSPAFTSVHQRSPAFTAPGGARVCAPLARDAPRNQEPKKEEIKSSKTQYQETKNPRIGAEPLLAQEGAAGTIGTLLVDSRVAEDGGDGGRAGVEAMEVASERSRENQVERIANRLLAAAHACERRCGITDPERRLKPHTARALARALDRAVTYYGDDVLEEYRRVLDSLDTREIENTGGYLVGAFKRRGWWSVAEKT